MLLQFNASQDEDCWRDWGEGGISIKIQQKGGSRRTLQGAAWPKSHWRRFNMRPTLTRLHLRPARKRKCKIIHWRNSAKQKTTHDREGPRSIFEPTVFFAMASLGLGFSARVLLPSIRSLIPALALPAIHLNIPTLLPGILESILRAVPKKKQSHSRKRMRQLAGKALKDVIALNKCPACGSVKRKNMLCEPCVESVKGMWRKEAAEESTPLSSPS